jgi:2-polyprenyl-6-methoxyphenol hydroxylase-like FAD-dependent oxidoreductase
MVRSFFQPKTSTWDFGQKACVFMAQGIDRGHAYEHFFPGGALALLAIDDGADAARLGKGVGIWIDRTQNVSSMDQRLAPMMHTVAPGSTPVDGTYRWFPVTGQWVHNPFFHRCVLVGDAACVIHPLAGQGLNIGLRMAQRLCDHVLLRRRTRCDWGQCLDSLFWPFYTIAGTMQMATYGMAHGLSLQSWDRAWTWGARLANAFPVVKDVILRASGKRS